MVLVTKEERDVIATRFPNVHIVRTMIQRSHRHHYYVEEAKGVMQLLQQMRYDPNASSGSGSPD